MVRRLGPWQEAVYGKEFFGVTQGKLFTPLSFSICKFGTALISGVACTLQRGSQYDWSRPEKAPASLAPLDSHTPACLRLQGLAFVKEQKTQETCPCPSCL